MGLSIDLCWLIYFVFVILKNGLITEFVIAYFISFFRNSTIITSLDKKEHKLTMNLQTWVCFVLFGMCFAQPNIVTVPTFPLSALENASNSEVEKMLPIVERLHIQSDIQFRYAKTVIESYLKNPPNSSSLEA